jgi:hypothetical protein
VDWWDYDNQISEDDRLAWNQQLCYHDWIPILLLTSTVYNCRKCNVKKEEYEASEKNKKR